MATEGSHSRPDWDIYFLDLADAVASRATCDRGRAGCIITRDRRIIVTGYVGSPPGFPHCDEVGHEIKKMIDEDGTVRQHCVRTIHAEQNAICQAAKYGVSLNGGTLYSKMFPCRTCAMLIISVGITRVVARKDYHGSQDSKVLFDQANLSVTMFDHAVEKYHPQ